jgi:hypothetical protein
MGKESQIKQPKKKEEGPGKLAIWNGEKDQVKLR